MRDEVGVLGSIRSQGDRVSKALAAALALAVAAGGCDRVPAESAKSASVEGRGYGDGASASSPFAGIADKETLPVRILIDRARTEEDPSVLAEGMDIEAFAAILSARQGLAGQDAERFREGFLAQQTSAKWAERAVGEILRVTRAGGDYQLLGMRRREGRTVAVYRLLGTDRELNYHEWAFVRSEDGRVRVADIYMHAVGEWLSDETNRLMELGLGKVGESVTPAQRAEREGIRRTMTELSRHSATGDAAAFDAAADTLPDRMRDDKFILLMGIRASYADPEQQARRVERLMDLFPEDPATDLVAVTVFSDRQHEEAIAASSRIAARIGGDPYLTILKAGFLIALDRLDEAEAAAHAALDRDDSLTDVYYTLALIASKRKDFPQAVSWIRALSASYGTPPQDLIDFDAEGLDPAWKDLERSEAWQALTDEPQSP